MAGVYFYFKNEKGLAVKSSISLSFGKGGRAAPPVRTPKVEEEWLRWPAFLHVTSTLQTKENNFFLLVRASRCSEFALLAHLTKSYKPCSGARDTECAVSTEDALHARRAPKVVLDLVLRTCTRCFLPPSNHHSCLRGRYIRQISHSSILARRLSTRGDLRASARKLV
jgi:hypothetical protein